MLHQGKKEKDFKHIEFLKCDTLSWKDTDDILNCLPASLLFMKYKANKSLETGKSCVSYHHICKSYALSLKKHFRSN